jgi:hypothetical protein
MKKPKLDVTRTVPKPSEILRHDENQTTIAGEKLKPETDYEGLERQWQREAWKERELFDSGGISDICSLDDLMRGEKSMAEKAKPKHERAGVLSVTIWSNVGEKGTYPTFSLQRGYTKDGKWANTETLRAQDLLPMAELLRSVYEKHVASKQTEGEQSS